MKDLQWSEWEAAHLTHEADGELRRMDGPANPVRQPKNAECRTRPLRRADELRLARRIQFEREQMRVALLSFDCIRVRVVQLLERILAGNVRLDRFLDVSVSQVDEKERIRGLLGYVIVRLKRIGWENDQDFRIAVDKRLLILQRRHAWRRIIRRRREAAALCGDVKIRLSKLMEMLPMLEGVSQHLNASRHISEQGAMMRHVRRQVRKQMLFHHDSAATLNRRLVIFQRHRAAYIRLRQRLALEHLGFVITIAKQYRTQGLGLLDLIQEGNVGLLKSIERFDPERGFRLATYAEWWIRQEIHVALRKTAGPFSMPRSLCVSIKQFQFTATRLQQELGRSAYVEEIAERMRVSAEKVREVLSIPLRHVSLEQARTRDVDLHLAGLIESRDGVGEVTLQLIKTRIQQVMEALTSRERKILQLRFGLNDGVQRTLAEVGESFALTRERIRQIEQMAVAKLRTKACRNRLEELEDLEEIVVGRG